MNWQRIETGVSFNGPESSFKFRTVNAGIEVRFHDWRNRLVRFQFRNVLHFQYSALCPLPGSPGEGAYVIEDSPLIGKLRECLALGRTEPARHYVLASNDDEWCEIVAESHGVSIDETEV